MLEGQYLYITREVEFSAAHRLYREEWSEEENRDVFGECANPHGHGHNYRLEVTVKGIPHPETGMIVHFRELKRILKEFIEADLDHRHLNHDVPFLAQVLPTSENLVRVLWQRLERAFQGRPYQLYRLRLWSTARNSVEFYG